MVAGTAAAIIGAVSTAGAAVIGTIIDRAFDGTVTPMMLGFLIAGLLALAIVAWADRGKLQRA